MTLARLGDDVNNKKSVEEDSEGIRIKKDKFGYCWTVENAESNKDYRNSGGKMLSRAC